MSKKTANSNADKASAKKVSDKRAKSLKFYSIGAVLILIAIALLINIFFDSLLGDALTFDFSVSGQNSITKVTQDYLNTLPKDYKIRIVGLMDKPESLTDTPYEYIVPLLDDYAAKSDGRITVEYINPETYPSIINELDPSGAYDLSADNFVVSCNGKVQVVAPIDCFTYDSQYLEQGQYLPTANNVEYTFTNTIVQLTNGYASKAYIISGLNEDDSSTQLTNILKALGCDTETLEVSDNFEIPDDCDLLILNGPNSDISERMAVKIQDYLNAGGNFFSAVNFYSNSADKFTNLNTVLNMMNLNMDPYVICEKDSTYYLDDTGFNSLVDISADFQSLSDDFSSFSQFKSSYARPIRDYDTPYSYIKTTPIATTSDSATAVQVDAQGNMSQYENASQYNIGMYSTFDGMDNPPEVIAFGTTNFSSDSYISNYGYSDTNVQFLRSCLRMLLGSGVNANSVDVESKSLDNYKIDSTKATSGVSSAVLYVFMVIIPLALVIVATVVYKKRKNL
ncbi:MAG: GldG family protein [Mageeibacillus sp.]|jgi:hypothetical protein|nr:GldG family protein [Mageeibacillus sp.]MCI1264054.1 GldG family protein [Saccharofermentans sp.]MCI1769593.1 GldG family protein [Mageeibacillus sp.]MCI2044020.1 GldG family protein [Mageeibacillus sp.]